VHAKAIDLAVADGALTAEQAAWLKSVQYGANGRETWPAAAEWTDRLRRKLRFFRRAPVPKPDGRRVHGPRGRR
jgi:hypothetical protein